MSKNFVITFGGTGARCAEAMLYLIASRVMPEPIHILVVDPDETNWNVAQVKSQLVRYRDIHEHVAVSSDSHKGAFFSTPVNDELGPDSFFWANPEPHTPFSTLIEYASLGLEEKGLIDLLYDSGDLDLSFERGYIGRAHIGSLDLLRALRAHVEAAARTDVVASSQKDALQQFFRSLRGATQRPGGARLLVIGSVFGGTGASGLPAIPPMLRQTLLSGLQQELAIGCVQLAHYFSFPQGGAEDPDSALHPLATQAALYHYALTDAGYDRVYLLGSPDREHANQDNAPGGPKQKNRPHYVELGAALAAAHFFDEADVLKDPSVYTSGAEQVDWDALPTSRPKEVQRQLVAFTTACMLHARFLSRILEKGKHRDMPWEREMRRHVATQLGGQEAELRELRDFGTRYLTWAAELQHASGVNLFTFSGDAAGALGRVAGEPESENPFHELMLRLNRVRGANQNDPVGWYMDALTRASIEFCRSNYSAWWGQ